MCGLILLDAGPHGILESSRYTNLLARVGGRGPHSHGWALLDGDWRWHTHYGSGPLVDLPEGEWRMGLGHSRLATSGVSAGTLPDPEHGQPIHLANRLVAHNGTLKHLASSGFPSDTHHAARLLDDHNPDDIFNCPDNSSQAVIIVDRALGNVTTYRGGDHGGHPLFHTVEAGVRIIASIRPNHESDLVPTGITQWTMI